LFIILNLSVFFDVSRYLWPECRSGGRRVARKASRVGTEKIDDGVEMERACVPELRRSLFGDWAAAKRMLARKSIDVGAVAVALDTRVKFVWLA
jgi:hypothetical protein